MNRIAAAALLLCGAAAYAQGPAPLVITSPANLGTRTTGISAIITHTATGGTPPLTWDITAGALPPGLSINAGTGTISGTPLLAGIYNFTVRVRDSATFTPQQSTTQAETLRIVDPLQIVTASPLPTQLPNTAFSIPIQGTGGVPPYFWSLSAAPFGVTINSSTGVLSSTGLSIGNYSITVSLGDSNDNSVERIFSLAVAQPPLQLVTASPLPAGAVGQGYSVPIQATGGFTPYSFSLSSSPAPPGLSLSSGGVLSGIPTQAGTYTFAVCVTDTPPPPPPLTFLAAAVVCRDYTVVISNTLALVTTSPLPPGVVGTSYSLSFQATGGLPPYSFSLSSSPAPPGLALSSAGVLSGIPTQAGTYAFAVCVADSPPPIVTDTVAATATVCRDYTLVINAGLALVTTSPLPPGAVGAPYSLNFQATGGFTPYTFSIAAGAVLPPGLAFNNAGLLNGTPTQAGDFTFRVCVTSATVSIPSATAPPPPQTVCQDYQLEIRARLTITTQSLATAFPTVPYNQAIQATGGIPASYVWSLTSGTLPAGLTLNAQTGVISGTTSGPQGDYPITVRVTDGQQSDSRPYVLVVGPALTILTPPALPEIQQGVQSSLVLAATGGLPPYTWSIIGGSLPTGTTLNQSTGAILGAPSAQGPFTFTAQVRDSVGAVASRTFNINISAPPAPPLFITTPSPLPDIPLGTFVSYGFAAQGGTPPYSFSLAGGTLPDGMTFAGGQVRGVPTRAGTFRFTIEVTDADQANSDKEFSVTVTTALSIITESPLPDQFVGVASSISIQATGGRPPYTFSTSGGALPPGLSMAASGAVSGTPTQAGNFNFTAQVRDQAGTIASRAFAVRIIGPPEITTGSPLVGLVLNQPAALSLAATGGRPAYTFTIDAGALPAGVSLGSTGAITGTPAQAGRFSFTARVTDQNRQFSTKAFTGEVVSGLTIVTESPLPNLVAGVAGGYSLAAAGGVEPFRWSATGLPEGMSIDTSGAVSGTPTTVGDYTLTATVTDARNNTATKALSGRVLPRLLITTESPLGAGTINVALNTSFSATGALGPITWGASGALPPGTSVSSAGVLSGTPTQAGTFSFNVTATSGPQSAEKAFQIAIRQQDLQSVILGGIGDNVQSGQQQRITLALGQPFPAEIIGTVTLTFQPNAVVNADDPAIQFSSGGRIARFTIPANQTAAAFTPPDLQLQTGTVAGVITLTTTLQSGGQPLGCVCPLTRQVTIARGAPVISQVAVQRTGNTFTVLVTGFSSTREISGATFRFAGSTALQTSEVSPPVGPTFVQFFTSAASQPLGGQFQLTMPFTINGDATAVTSVTVTLTNTAGASQSLTRTF